MAFYRQGTVTVTNGSPNIKGFGTEWLSSRALLPTGGSLIKLPDGGLYEVLSVAGNEDLVIGEDYRGPSQAGSAYSIVPVHGAVARQLNDSVDVKNASLANRTRDAALNTGNYANRPDDGTYASDFGASTAATDNSQAINNAIAAILAGTSQPPLITSGTLHFTAPVIMNSWIPVRMNGGAWVWDGTGSDFVTIGGNALQNGSGSIPSEFNLRRGTINYSDDKSALVIKNMEGVAAFIDIRDFFGGIELVGTGDPSTGNYSNTWYVLTMQGNVHDRILHPMTSGFVTHQVFIGGEYTGRINYSGVTSSVWFRNDSTQTIIDGCSFIAECVEKTNGGGGLSAVAMFSSAYGHGAMRNIWKGLRTEATQYLFAGIGGAANYPVVSNNRVELSSNNIRYGSPANIFMPTGSGIDQLAFALNKIKLSGGMPFDYDHAVLVGEFGRPNVICSGGKLQAPARGGIRTGYSGGNTFDVETPQYSLQSDVIVASAASYGVFPFLAIDMRAAVQDFMRVLNVIFEKPTGIVPFVVALDANGAEVSSTDLLLGYSDLANGSRLAWEAPFHIWALNSAMSGSDINSMRIAVSGSVAFVLIGPGNRYGESASFRSMRVEAQAGSNITLVRNPALIAGMGRLVDTGEPVSTGAPDALVAGDTCPVGFRVRRVPPVSGQPAAYVRSASAWVAEANNA